MNFDLFLAPFEQLLKAPACAFIILPISLVAYVIETFPAIPSRLVLPVSLILGSFLYPLLTPTSTVPAGIPNPLVVLVLNGFVVGFVSWLAHKFVVKKLIEKYAGPPGNTEFFSKPKDPTDPKPPTP